MHFRLHGHSSVTPWIVIISLAVLTGLLMLIFKYLPDVKVPRRVFGPRGIVTAVLFTIGIFCSDRSLPKAPLRRHIGAAGSLAGLLHMGLFTLGVNLFFGAELSQVLCNGRWDKVQAKSACRAGE